MPPSLLEQLSAGALDWLGGNLDHFDPFSATTGSATRSAAGSTARPAARSATRPAARGKAKAALELGLLCHRAARPDDTMPDPLSGATALVRKLWQDPDFPRLFDDSPAYASTYRLVYAALAPDGIDDTLCREELARLEPDFLSPGEKSPYRRIEIRYYADKAGVRHGIEPYAELLPQSPLVALRAARPTMATPAPAQAAKGAMEPLTVPQAYALTHTAFYLGDFGRTDPRIAGADLEHARDLTHGMLLHCVAHDLWDLVAELVLTQFVLGEDPLRTPSGAAAVECLARAQRPDGAIPGRSAALRAAPHVTAGEFFRTAYHTTLVTALMASIVASPRGAS
ncbi:hypothetical protein PV371_14025 [Streptomyces sp. TX20-6-3]|uniref:DUF6895 family protein n=1 Tax=Streptomyces sp. TX20-6-3 TaxID=3028705 RepID=UPI0029BDCD44|nr:hypothetical protein [Streptomyces sp. TX20-6-3]MDX2560763.1 hypothetical protein [Streptomyces sp. TX20-6-3]